MVNHQKALELISETLESLQRSGIIEPNRDYQNETVLLGVNSPLDSIGFVTFITELEDRVCSVLGSEGEDFALVLNDIHDFNPKQNRLTVETVAQYIAKATDDQKV